MLQHIQKNRLMILMLLSESIINFIQTEAYEEKTAFWVDRSAHTQVLAATIWKITKHKWIE